MSCMVLVFSIGVIAGLIGVACNPSPYFAALGLMVTAGMGCGLLATHGVVFLSLVLFLIYLGGMLVVFAFTAALAAERHPESLGEPTVAIYLVSLLLAVAMMSWALWDMFDSEITTTPQDVDTFILFLDDMGGVEMMYVQGAGPLILGAWALLMALVIMLMLVRGGSRGGLRAP